MPKGMLFFALLVGSVAATLAGREAETTIYHGDGTTTVMRGMSRGAGFSVRSYPSRSGGPLTPDKRYFSVRPAMISPEIIPGALRRMEQLTGELRAMLNREKPPVHDVHMPAWGGLVAGRQFLQTPPVDQDSPLQMLALMYVSRFREADALGRKILDAHPDDYAATVLLGFLSIYDPKNWSCFEKAFTAAPDDTLRLFCWHLQGIAIRPQTEWDFVGAFYNLLEKHADRWDFQKLPPSAQFLLMRGFRAKYGADAARMPALDRKLALPVRGASRPATGADMPPSPRRGAAERARLARVVALTADKKYFASTPPALTETDRRSARKSMDPLLRDVRELLAHKTKPVVSSLYPAWGEIVAASTDPSSLGADRQSAVYMLSLMFAERFDEAEKLGRDILAARPDDYGATVLLGFLAIRDKRNFPYLEKAFAAAPDFTPHLFEWQLKQLKIAPREPWDFADAFYRMLGRHPEIDFFEDIWLQLRLKRGFLDKYGDFNDSEVCDALPEELQKAAAKLRQVRVMRFR